MTIIQQMRLALECFIVHGLLLYFKLGSVNPALLHDLFCRLPDVLDASCHTHNLISALQINAFLLLLLFYSRSLDILV